MVLGRWLLQGGAQLKKATLDELLTAWDDVSAAIDRVVTAQPANMTAAAEELERSRRVMRDRMNGYALDAMTKKAG